MGLNCPNFYQVETGFSFFSAFKTQFHTHPIDPMMVMLMMMIIREGWFFLIISIIDGLHYNWDQFNYDNILHHYQGKSVYLFVQCSAHINHGHFESEKRYGIASEIKSIQSTRSPQSIKETYSTLYVFLIRISVDFFPFFHSFIINGRKFLRTLARAHTRTPAPKK